jgi:hypothetical protein
MAVRICLRVAQLCSHAILQLLRFEVLQPLGLFVNFVPSLVQNMVQETFAQTGGAAELQAHASFPKGNFPKRELCYFVPIAARSSRWAT